MKVVFIKINFSPPIAYTGRNIGPARPQASGPQASVARPDIPSGAQYGRLFSVYLTKTMPSTFVWSYSYSSTSVWALSGRVLASHRWIYHIGPARHQEAAEYHAPRYYRVKQGTTNSLSSSSGFPLWPYPATEHCHQLSTFIYSTAT